MAQAACRSAVSAPVDTAVLPSLVKIGFNAQARPQPHEDGPRPARDQHRPDTEQASQDRVATRTVLTRTSLRVTGSRYAGKTEPGDTVLYRQTAEQDGDAVCQVCQILFVRREGIRIKSRLRAEIALLLI